MYYKLDEKEQEYIKQAQEHTCTDYDLEGDFIPVDALMNCIEDLLYTVDYLEEQIEDLKEN